MDRAERILSLAHCRSVKAIALNIEKRRIVFKHDDVLDAAADRRVAIRGIRAIAVRH